MSFDNPCQTYLNSRAWESVLLEQLVIPARPATLDILARQGTPGLRGLSVIPDSPGRQGIPEIQALKESPDIRGQRDILELPGQPDTPAQPAILVQLEVPDTQVLLALKG